MILAKRFNRRGDCWRRAPVFRCELSAVELQGLKNLLWPLLNLGEDRVMIVDLGPVEGRGDDCLEFWGNPKVVPQEREATIV